MRIIFALLLLPLALLAADPDPIPTDRRVDWTPGTTVGVQGGIPTTRTQWTNFVTAGADNTGVVPCHALLQTLINTCPSNQYIYVPAGSYMMTARAVMNGTSNGWSIVGAGMNSTKFYCSNGFVGLDNYFYTPTLIHTTILKGATTLITRSDVSSSVGGLAEINSSDDGRTDRHVQSTDMSDRQMTQLVHILAVSNGTNVTFEPPLYWNHYIAQTPYFAKQDPVISQGYGFEGFSLYGTNTANGWSMAPGVQWFTIFGGMNIYWKGLRIYAPLDIPFNLSRNLFWEVRDCEFTSFLAGSGTAVIITYRDCGGLVENNFSIGGSPFIEMNAGAGNAVAYNYVTNAVSNDYHVGNPYDHHQPHSMMNLWEGNYGCTFQQDAYFGSSSDDTLFRNWFTGFDPIKFGIPRCIDLNRWTTYYNIVGNVLGHVYGTTNFGEYWYTVTNRYGSAYPDFRPVIYRLGFPYPGNTSYGYNVTGGAIRTPGTGWQYPGSNFYGGVITQVTALTNIIYGDFSLMPDGGVQGVTIQSASNTNLYYPLQTNSPKLAYTVATASSLTLNKLTWVTNGDYVYGIGPNAWPALQLDDTNTHLFIHNWDWTNKVVINPTNSLRNSYLYGSTPPRFTNVASTWPVVNPDATGGGTNYIWPAQADYYGLWTAESSSSGGRNTKNKGNAGGRSKR